MIAPGSLLPGSMLLDAKPADHLCARGFVADALAAVPQNASLPWFVRPASVRCGRGAAMQVLRTDVLRGPNMPPVWTPLAGENAPPGDARRCECKLHGPLLCARTGASTGLPANSLMVDTHSILADIDEWGVAGGDTAHEYSFKDLPGAASSDAAAAQMGEHRCVAMLTVEHSCVHRLVASVQLRGRCAHRRDADRPVRAQRPVAVICTLTTSYLQGNNVPVRYRGLLSRDVGHAAAGRGQGRLSGVMLSKAALPMLLLRQPSCILSQASKGLNRLARSGLRAGCGCCSGDQLVTPSAAFGGRARSAAPLIVSRTCCCCNTLHGRGAGVRQCRSKTCRLGRSLHPSPTRHQNWPSLA